jgi:hypothetical protein
MGEFCCLVGQCCPPAAQQAALAKWLVAKGVCSKAYAPKLAKKLAPALKALAKKAKAK